MINSIIDEPTPTIQNILLTHRKVRNPSSLVGGTDLEDTPESKELLKLERLLSKNLLAILTFIIRNESITRSTNDDTTNSTTIKQNPKVGDLKRKYGFLFSNVFRSNIEDIYRLGGAYGMRFPELPILAYHTTDADLVLIRKYTSQYHQRIWHRIDKFLLNTGRKPDAPPIRVSFIVNTLAAEIATFVMMEATKEKTRQVLSLLDPNNLNSTLVSETASHTKKHKKEEEEQELLKQEAEADEAERAFDEERNPEADLAAAVLNALIATRTLNEARKLQENYYFMWPTARDDRVCLQYCKPLDGVLWKVSEMDSIPVPDQLSHPFCRCRLIKVRI